MLLKSRLQNVRLWCYDASAGSFSLMVQHIQAWTKWPIFRKRYFEMQFREWKPLLVWLNVHLNWLHDDVIKWKHIPRYWPFVQGIHRSPVNSPHRGQWRGAWFSLICVWINDWVNNREAGDLGRHHAHYDVIVMIKGPIITESALIQVYNSLAPSR